MMLSIVAATIMSKSHAAICSIVGLRIILPSIRPILTSDTASAIGMSETCSAADAARQASASGESTLSEETS